MFPRGSDNARLRARGFQGTLPSPGGGGALGKRSAYPGKQGGLGGASSPNGLIPLLSLGMDGVF